MQILSREPIGGVADLPRTIDQVLAQSPGRMLVAIVSDLLGPVEPLRQALAICRHRRHDVILLETLDRQELRFSLDDPAPFLGLEGESMIEADPRAIRRDYLDALRSHLEEVHRTARSFGFDHLVLDTHDSVGPALAAMLARRDAMLRRGRS